MEETIMISTALLLAFICLRRILDGKISARLQYGIWLLIAARLLLVWIPLPESSISVTNLLPALQDTFYTLQERNTGDMTKKPESDSGQKPAALQSDKQFPQEDSPIQNGTLSQDAEKQQTNSDSRSGQGQGETRPSKTKNGPAAVDLLPLIYRIYGIGAVGALLWMIAKNLWFWNRLRRKRILYEGELPVAALPGRLYMVEQLKSPFLFGKHIYVSPKIISNQQKLRHILVHETCHWKQGDSFWSVLRCFCLAVYWYHPLVWYGVHLSIVDAELACDERAILILGDGNCLDYGETLLGLIRNQSGFLECTNVSTQMSGNKKETKMRLERIVGQRKRNRGRVLFLAASMVILCLATLPGNKTKRDAVTEVEVKWERVEQEGFPCIVVDEQGNITGTRRGELLKKVVLDYMASKGNLGSDFCSYQIQADAFSACQNLRTLVLPCQDASKFTSVIDYIDPDAFRGCPKDLVVYCDKESYAWTRLGELGITVKEIPDEDWCLSGEDTDTLKRIQNKINTEENNSTLTDQEMRQFYGEPFFMMSESGQIFSAICKSLFQYTEDRKIYFPTDAHTLTATFPQFLLVNQPVTIPKNIVVIGEATFMCSQIPEILFEEGSELQTIGNNAFWQEKITEIQLPEGLQTLGDSAFGECQDLREITIPQSVRSVGERCFSMCDSLERVVVLNPDTTFGKDVFPLEILNPDLKEEDIDMENLDSNFVHNDRLTIACHPGSNAEKYAMENGLQVEYLQ